MNWKDLKNEKAEEGGLFVRWEDGDVRNLIPLGGLEKRETHWTGERMVTCPGRDVCDRCKSGERSGVKYLVNVFDEDEDSVRIWEMGWRVSQDVREELEEGKFPMYPKLRVKRRGKGTDTTYKVRLTGHVDEDSDQADYLDRRTQHDLVKYTKPRDDDDAGDSGRKTEPARPDETTPF